LLAISSILFVLHASNAVTTQGDVLGEKHLFIEVWEHQDGKIISGKAHKMMIDFPTYHLENSTLKSMTPFDVNPSSLLILGKGSSLSGDMGGGAASGLHAIKELPYLVGSYSCINISISKIQGDNVTLDLSGRELVLEKGESWKREKEETQQIQDSLIDVTNTVTVWNHGRVSIESPKSSPDNATINA